MSIKHAILSVRKYERFLYNRVHDVLFPKPIDLFGTIDEEPYNMELAKSLRAKQRMAIERAKNNKPL